MNVHSLEWFDLRKHAEMKMQRSDFGQVPSADWDNLLMRFRKLREALTAAAAPADLRCEVYEISADVCAAADNMAELLKCLQQLVNNIYPALWCMQQQQQQQHKTQLSQDQQLMQESTKRSCQQQQQQQRQNHHQQQQQWQQADRQQLQHGKDQQPPRVGHLDPQKDHHKASQQAYCGAAASSSSPAHTVTATRSSSSSSGKHSQQRYAEVASALLLYFACIPRCPVIQEINKQLRAAARPKPYCQGSALIANPVYHRAVLDTVAALRCDWCSFLNSYHSESQPPPLVRVVMRQHVERLKVEAVCRVGVAYRMLPTAVLQRWLWLQQGDTSCSTHSSSSNTVAGSNSSQRGATGSPATATGPSTVPYQQLVALLQTAANSGSRAAAVAVAQCTELGSLPLTLQFRAQST